MLILYINFIPHLINSLNFIIDFSMELIGYIIGRLHCCIIISSIRKVVSQGMRIYELIKVCVG